jgi:hypothetical protein
MFWMVASRIQRLNLGQPRASSRLNPDISCPARNARIPERRLAVGLGIAMTLKAD